MKSNFMVLLFFVVPMCKAAKFPIHLSHQDEAINEEEIVPVTVNSAVNQDCDFCTDYMLEDCNCADVIYCKSCYVPDKCDVAKCDGNPIETEETVPGVAQDARLTSRAEPTKQPTNMEKRAECQYCALMYWGCSCADVNYCLNKWNCPVKPLCLKKCPTTTKTKPPPVTVPVTVPVTTASATTNKPSAGPTIAVRRAECQYCELMYWGCSCDDANYCINKWNCPVKPLCLKQCGLLQ